MSDEGTILLLIGGTLVVLVALVLGRHFSLSRKPDGTIVARAEGRSAVLKTDDIRAGGSARLHSGGDIDVKNVSVQNDLVIRAGVQGRDDAE